MKYMSQEKFRWLDGSKTATFPFVVQFPDGRRGEAVNPLYLMNLIIHPCFSDVDDIETFYMLCVKALKDFAGSTLSMDGIRAVVYDALGPMFDNGISRYADEVEEEHEIEFTNAENPTILDGFDPWTVVASFIQTGYLKILEKTPVWSDSKKCQGCKTCVFHNNETSHCSVWESSSVFETWNQACPFVTNGENYEEYHEVLPEEIASAAFKYHWIPIHQRTKEYIGLRNTISSLIEEE